MNTSEMQAKIEEIEELIGKARGLAEVAALLQAQALFVIAQTLIR